MDSADSSGLLPYNFEPEYSPDELIVFSSMDDATLEETLQYSATDEWCSCNNCGEMMSELERVCCKTSDLTIGSLDSYECITEHSDFEAIVLNPVILEVAFIQIMAFKSQTGRAPDSLSNRQSRLTAYRQFICWMKKGERLGKRNRVVIPSCVVLAIRNIFPDPDDNYTGFQSVLEDVRDLFR